MAERAVGPGYLDVEAQLGGTFLHPGGRDLTRYLLQELAGEPSPRRVLEIGCGTGSTTALIARLPQTRVCALERSDAMLRAARQTLRAAGVAGQISLVRADANVPLPLTDATFDAACAESVAALLNLETVFPELHRVLRPGGRLILNERIWKPGVTASEAAQVNAASRRAFGIPAATPQPWNRHDWLHLLHDAGFVDLACVAVDDLLGDRAPAWHIGQRAGRLRRYLAQPALLASSLRFKAGARRQAELWARLECFVFLARRSA